MARSIFVGLGFHFWHCYFIVSSSGPAAAEKISRVVCLCSSRSSLAALGFGFMAPIIARRRFCRPRPQHLCAPIDFWVFSFHTPLCELFLLVQRHRNPVPGNSATRPSESRCRHHFSLHVSLVLLLASEAPAQFADELTCFPDPVFVRCSYPGALHVPAFVIPTLDSSVKYWPCVKFGVHRPRLLLSVFALRFCCPESILLHVSISE
jgi:hypothetical protein